MNLNTTAEDACNVAATTLTFGPPQSSLDQKSSNIICIGRQGSSSLQSDVIAKLISPSGVLSDPSLLIINALMKGIKDSGKATTFLPSSETTTDGEDELIKLTVIVLPSADKISRNNNAFSPHKLTEYLNDIGLHSTSCEKFVQINVIDNDLHEYSCCVAAAIARALPLYHSKSSSKKKKEEEDDDKSTTATGVNVTFYKWAKNVTTLAQLAADSDAYQTSKAVSLGIRLAAKLGDMPPAELNPTTYSNVCKSIATKLGSENVTFEEILGEELKEKGYGGIYGVGMAAQCPPRMIVMTYTPADGKYNEHVALCGKVSV